MTDDSLSSWNIGRGYESVVAEIVSKLEFFRAGQIYRNKKYEGKVQPGRYEIDISLEVVFDEVLAFLLIIECKNQGRPVDRPTVQQLAQTRDAISAHKAVIASSVGFSREAVELARVKGIALWVIESDAPASHIDLLLPCMVRISFTEETWERDAEQAFKLVRLHLFLYLGGVGLLSGSEFERFSDNNRGLCWMCLTLTDNLALPIQNCNRWTKGVLFFRWSKKACRLLEFYGKGIKKLTIKRAIAAAWRSDFEEFRRAPFAGC